ncbi:MAG: hypothetical protein QME70_10360 [Bacillota bacterium]|nr:hypothetical protein [Bacillota bacterium]
MDLVFLALAVSLDGMWAGLAQGLRRRRITAWQIAAVGAESALGSALAMAAGTALAGSLGGDTAIWLAAAVFLAAACWHFREALRYRRPTTSPRGTGASAAEEGPLEWSLLILIGGSVAVDASLTACALAMAGYRSPLVPPLFGMAHVVLVGLGNGLGRRIAVRAAVWPAAIPLAPIRLNAHCSPTAWHEQGRTQQADACPAEPTETRTLLPYRLLLGLAPGVILLLLGTVRVVQALGH